MTGGVAVTVDAVSKRFRTDAGDVVALDGISLVAEAGTSTAIVGPSGCGKSTLLSLIGGLEVPDQGRVLLGGSALSDLPEKGRARLRRERMGFVFQMHNLQPFLTALENVTLQLALSGAPQLDGRAESLLARLGLDGAGSRYPDQLSGGERQRVAVARALVHRPSLVLADEPTGALDRGNAFAVIDLLCEVQRSVGATMVVITHDPAIAERLDRTVALGEGRTAVPC